jgi:hypothetical protein
LFQFKLALALGIGLEGVAAMGAREFSLWQLYDSINPFGDERADLRAGLSTSALINIQLGKGAEPISALDFMPFTVKPEQKPRSILDNFKAIFKEGK